MARNVASDFSDAPTRFAWGPGALFATFALGFTEGCLEVKRRPIPLRFALRFAAVNVLPSAVWSSIPARDVAAASNVALSTLMGRAEVGGKSTAAVGKRLVLIKSVRALRCIVGSYGLGWSLWRLYSREDEQSTSYEESVVRVAPVNSPLSKVSRKKHGEHVVTVPVAKSWTTVVNEVDWENVGIEVENEEQGTVERVKVMEVELSDETAEYARRLSAKASRDASAEVFSVAVLPMNGPPLPTKMIDSFDVCFNPLSAVLTFIAEVCHRRNVTHAILIGAGSVDNVNANRLEMHLSTTQVAAGLLYRHGIISSVLKAPQPEEVDDEVENELLKNSASSAGVVFFVSKSLHAGRAVANKLIEQGLVVKEDACFVVADTLSGQNLPSDVIQAQSPLLEATASIETEGKDGKEQEEVEAIEQNPVATYLSVMDVSDQTLQAIRMMLRRGTALGAAQAAIYRAYGTQRVVTLTRIDQFSNMNV